jgi:hypothetical protein
VALGASTISASVSAWPAPTNKLGNMRTLFWRCAMAQTQLRLALQRCRSRTRLALQALGRYRARLANWPGRCRSLTRRNWSAWLTAFGIC